MIRKSEGAYQGLASAVGVDTSSLELAASSAPDVVAAKAALHGVWQAIERLVTRHAGIKDAEWAKQLNQLSIDYHKAFQHMTATAEQATRDKLGLS